MSPIRLLAIIFIFCCTVVAWFVLGISVQTRSGETDFKIAQEVAQLYGGAHNQAAPGGAILRPRQVIEDQVEKDSQGKETRRKVSKTVFDSIPVPLQSSAIHVTMDLDQRQKGLLWYNTYGVEFSGDYRLRNPDAEPRALIVHFAFPSKDAIYDGFVFTVNGREAAGDTNTESQSEEGEPVSSLDSGTTARVDLPAGGEALVQIAYKSRGLGAWTYALSSGGVAQVKDFLLELKTDFSNIDFPAGTMSPSSRAPEGKGLKLTWKFASLVTGQKIGMDPPRPMNPGPLAARISFFAPVSLLFFLTVMVILGALRGNSLHPMNYFFIAAAFFAFHLLLAYLVDHLNLHAAFLIAAAVSVILVASYLRLVGGLRFALLTAAPAQLIFLVFFSYAFFFEGYTGLTVTVGAVVTLFALMQLTGKVEWGKVFSKKAASEA